MTRRSDDPISLPAGVDRDQLAFAFDAPPAAATDRAPAFRSYDAAVLHFVAQQRLVTAHQVVYRFATYDGKHRGHIVRVIRSLVDRGWLRSAKLQPELGRASRQVLMLSDMAWRDRRREPPPDPMSEPTHIREGRLQGTEFLLEHECRGWRRAGGRAAAWQALKAAALHHYRTADRSELGQAQRTLIEKLKPEAQRPLPVAVWVHPATRSAMLVMRSRRGLNLGATLAAMPSLILWPEVRVHLVGADADRVARDAELVRRWAIDTRHRVVIEALDPFRTRPNPSEYGRLPTSMYALHGVPSPRAAFAFGRRGSHAPSVTCDVNSDHQIRVQVAEMPPRPLTEGLNPRRERRQTGFRPSRLCAVIPSGPSAPVRQTAGRPVEPPQDQLVSMRAARRRIRLGPEPDREDAGE